MRRRTLVIGSALLGGAALVLFCCGGSDRHAAEMASPPAPAPSQATLSATAGASAAAPSASVDARALAPAGTSPSEQSPPSNAAVPSASGAPAPSAAGPSGAGIIEAVKGNDPRDLEFLASIERKLQRDPPPEVHALVAARKRGASRAELASAIQRLPALDLRVLAERWLDEVAPRPR